MRKTLRKNDEITLKITGTAHDGSGVGRWEGMAVFVPACAEGDMVRAHVVAVRKKYAFAKLETVVSPGPGRVEPDCPAFPRCGGCAFRHLSYRRELELKRARVADALRRIGGLDVTPDAVVGCEPADRYRNKAEYPVEAAPGGFKAGFFARGSHRIIENDDCLLQPEVFGRALTAFRRWAGETGVSVYDERTGRGLLRHIYLRLAEATGQLMACAVVNGDELPRPERLAGLLEENCAGFRSLILNVNRTRGNVILGPRCVTLSGSDTITDRICGLEIELSPLSFYQVNRRAAERLYGIAAQRALGGGCRLLLDLYCGAGTIGLSMASRTGRVIGVEIVGDAVKDARRNAERNGIRNAEFFCADAATAAEQMQAQGLSPDAVVVDPPRRGCSPETLTAICRMAPRRIVYVSCDPATLARDLKLLSGLGYRCDSVTPVDLFPRTAHVECVVLMTNCRSDG